MEAWIRELYFAVLKRLGDEGNNDAKIDAAEQAITGSLPVIHHALPSAAFEGVEFCVRVEGELDEESTEDEGDEFDDVV